MQEHFIELSNRYSIKLSETEKYIIYKIELQENGTYERVGGKVCKDLFAVVDTLILCELMDEDVISLSAVAKKLEEIYAEVKRIAEIQSTYSQA
ncbi:MAG: hypothetical protein E7J23_06750 [Haemophilus parainfluenzae]|jgi:uncharacterized 10.8 kDa protein in cox-rep intergenic region|uniref:Cell division protein ZapA n=1 Tax=Haemophilus parainfluenzae TaxID=729 RepID=A0AB36E8R7_HAEPA|nr:hypothetical protein [Haemophilus parainfluenzae]MDU4564952.1 hypothetical protein [Haemophilus parainfluenzae]MDU4636936.1 hypothetical protein [Haemophilus parainfluenzae]MDU5989635.1 hypothetical protein [Haemophilus parainfluenzae]MDU7969842.1 hypothetical protein [Haemophilus parainfluenzae]OBY51120.1 hypothetical protein BBB48_06875 [Haemophilus parainfluenzae]